MELNLTGIHNKLKEIRTYLIKIGRDRRTIECVNRKINEANQIYKCLDQVNKQVKLDVTNKEYTDEDIQKLNALNGEIRKIYKEILNFSKSTSTSVGSKMAFDLKTAVSLLPVMNDDEAVTMQLIDAIELYDTMLESTGKPSLINFVLKTRLSVGAKLRLKSNYDSVALLISDMKTHLITRKSDTALQTKLMRATQGNRSVSDFGKEIEEIFVNLTISQANGESTAFNILKAVNEKNAIKRFADGLRNQKLSTIVASRNFSSLKDAIQVAQDEEISRFGPENQIMTANHNKRNYNNASKKYKPNQGSDYSHKNWNYSHKFRRDNNANGSNYARGNTSNTNRNFNRNKYSTGKVFNHNHNNNSFRKYQSNKQINHVQETTKQNTEVETRNHQFFRESNN